MLNCPFKISNTGYRYRYLLDDIHAFDNGAKDDMLPVQPLRLEIFFSPPLMIYELLMINELLIINELLMINELLIIFRQNLELIT